LQIHRLLKWHGDCPEKKNGLRLAHRAVRLCSNTTEKSLPAAGRQD
jgi:hypothetical protein